MSLRLGVSLVVCLVLAEVGYGAEPEGALAENAPRQREVVCHCQFVELVGRGRSKNSFAAADVVAAARRRRAGLGRSGMSAG